MRTNDHERQAGPDEGDNPKERRSNQGMEGQGGVMPTGKEDIMGGWRQPTREERESSAMGRFELVCEAYSNANELQRRKMLDMLNDDERHVFLKGCGLYRIFRDQRLYDAIKKAVGERIYKDIRGEVE